MLHSVVDKFPKWAKILLTIFGGASVVYRAFLFIDDCIAKAEKKNVTALIGAIVAIIPIADLVILLIDLFGAVIPSGEMAKILR